MNKSYWQQKANQSNIYYCVIVYALVTAIFSQGNSIKKAVIINANQSNFGIHALATH